MGTEGSLSTLHAPASFYHFTGSRSEWRFLRVLCGGCSPISLPGGITHSRGSDSSPGQVDSDRHPGDPAVLGFEESLASWVSAKRECDSLWGVPFVTQVIRKL